MIPVNLGDVVGGLATAQHLYKIGFRKASNASQKYREFGEDIRNLAVNLDLLSDVIQRAQYQAGVLDRASRYTSPVPGIEASAAQQILGNFRETLNDCGYLLNDQNYFHKCDGFVSNISRYYQIDPEVQKLRERISFHNLKLSLSLKILQSQILEDRSIQIIDSTTAIMSAVEQLGQHVRGEEEGEDLLNQLPGSVAIPLELQDCFITLTQQAYPDFSTLSLCRGIDAALFYFNRVTKMPDQLVQSEIRYLIAIIDIMKAAWMLQTVKASQEFQIASKNRPTNAFEQQMDQWGMTVERFFDKFEEEIHEAFRLLLGRHLLLPPTPDLLEVFEKERQLWLGEFGTTMQKKNEQIDLGKEIMSAHLRSSDPGYTQTIQVYRQTIQVYRQTEKRFNLLLLKTCASEGREKETIDGYDLERVQIIPSYAKRTWTSPSVEPQTILFRVDSVSPVSRVLMFQQNKDLFEFQQIITGYKVVHDDNRVLATSQESKLLRGTRRQDLCRLQLWSAPSPKADIVAAKQAPYSVPTAVEWGRSSQDFFANSKSSRRKNSTSNLSIFSSGLRSSSSSSSVVTDPPSLPNLSGPAGAFNTPGTIYTAPVTPCIVLFAHKALAASRGSDEDETSRSFLIIDNVTIQEELTEYEHTHSPSYRCVLEKKGSYLPARRSPETTDAGLWDLSVAGVHKKPAGTEVVKRLKHVIIQFDNQTNLLQFMTKFNQIKDLAKLRLSQLVPFTMPGPGAGTVELP